MNFGRRKKQEIIVYTIKAVEEKGGIGLSANIEDELVLSNEKLVRGLMEVLKKSIIVLDDALKRLKRKELRQNV